MSVQRLKYVQALGKHRNFKHAATELGISQPALSKAVKQLEDQYGVVLFDRSTRQVKPTEFGLILMNYADRILPQYNEIEREIELLKGFERGRLVIACDAFHAETVIADALKRMLADHPRLRYKIVTGQVDDLLHQLNEKRVDIVVGAPVDDLLPHLEYEEYRSSHAELFCRPDHPLLKQKEIDLKDCFDYPIVGIDTPSWVKKWIADDTGFSEEDEKVISPVLAVCDNYGLIFKLVKETDSISAAPVELLEPKLESGEFVSFSVNAGRPPRGKFGVATLSGRLVPPAMKRFLEVLKEVMDHRD
jgi:DNA-binding transcriptional LysR family regulator